MQVTLKLTPDIMQQIFQEKPHMKRAHNKLVPHTLSEKEFWEKFFNYEVQRKVSCFPSCTCRAFWIVRETCAGLVFPESITAPVLRRTEK